jgi:hypothetical protein
METEEIKRRFDDTLRTLFIITSIIISVTIGFFRENLGLVFIMESFISFVASVMLWCFANMIDGSREYIVKLASWHLFIYTLTISLTRMALNQLSIPLIIGFISLVIIFAPTIAIRSWFLRNDVIDAEDSLSRRILWILGLWTVQLVVSITFVG